MTPAEHRASSRSPFYAWIWLAIIGSITLCAALSWLRYEQSKTLAAATQVLETLHQARTDLARGFLNVSLADHPQSPFRRLDGMALINQAIAGLHDIEVQNLQGNLRPLSASHTDTKLAAQIAIFRRDLTAWLEPNRLDRDKLVLRLRIDFHDLDQLAIQLTQARQSDLRTLENELDRTFALTILVAALILGALCTVIVIAGRQHRQAATLLEAREAQLRLVGDHLPNGYIYRYVRGPSGEPEFTYISAGVERVHGVSAESCRRHAQTLLGLMLADQLPAYLTAETKSARDLTEFDMDLRFRHPDGRLRIIHVSSKPSRDDAGGTFWDGVAVDVTSHRQTEALIRKNAELLEDMGRVAKVGGWELDLATGQGEWTAEVARIHGVDPTVKPDLALGLSFYPPESRARIQAALKATLDQGASYELELELIPAVGTPKWVRTIGVPIVENGRVVRLRGSFQDITELKQAELALRQREQQLRLFIEHSPTAIAMLDQAMCYMAVSRRWLLDYRLELSAVTGKSHYEIFPDLPERWKAIHQRCLAGAVEKCEADPFPRADGRTDWVRWEIVPWHQTPDRIGGIILFSEVITEQREAQAAIQRTQENYREIFNATSDAIFLHEAATGRLLDINEAMLQLFGYGSKAEVLATGPETIIGDAAPYSWEEARAQLARANQEGPQIFEWWARRKNGSRFWVEVSMSRSQIDGQDRILAVVRDISQRKTHELEIERLNRLYSTLSQVNQVIVRCRNREELFQEICRVMIQYANLQSAWIGWQATPNGPVTVAAQEQARSITGTLPANPQACRLHQRMLAQTQAIFCHQATHDDSAGCCRTLMPRAGIQSCGVFPIRCQGEIRGSFSLASSEENFFNAGEIRLLEEITNDISYALERLEEQSQRQQAEADRDRLAAAMEQTAELIVITDVRGQILYVNPAFEKTTGYSRAEVLGKNPRLLNSGRQDPAFYRRLWETVLAGEIWRGQFINRKKSGAFYHEDATISPVRNTAGETTCFIGVKRDITREMALEEQVRQAQKLEGIGQLAGGVAHDFNNILGAIMMQAQISSTQENLPPGLAEDMHQIRLACERGENLTRQLLLFSRRQVLQPRDLDLNDVVVNITKMLQRIIGENIAIQMNLHPRPLLTHADAGMLDQVLLNLAVNGRDAMRHSGRLMISTREARLTESQNDRPPDVVPGDYVVLAVSDNGCGIPPEILPRIFEPFFTTKEPGKGTGLGLATVFGIIKQHHGWIDVQSSPGLGTTFTAYLPAIPAQVPASPAPAQPAPTNAGSETILLVEDDSSVRKVTRKFLLAHGYTVLEAANGVEARQVWQENRERIDLLLTDLLMPEGINGLDLSRQLQADRPQLKVVYVSGYSADLMGHWPVNSPAENFLPKPVKPALLLATIRQQLKGE
ncbi:MAG TPA: PAS domain S-box protein, partial [Verrucomicrobiae bacterium]